MAEDGSRHVQENDPATGVRDGASPPRATETAVDKALIFPAARRAFTLGGNLVELKGNSWICLLMLT